jgi:hypothetical protein
VTATCYYDLHCGCAAFNVPQASIMALHPLCSLPVRWRRPVVGGWTADFSLTRVLSDATAWLIHADKGRGYTDFLETNPAAVVMCLPS